MAPWSLLRKFPIEKCRCVASCNDAAEGGSKDGMSGTAELPLPATKNGHSHTGSGGGVVTLNLPSASRPLKAASCRGELLERACDHGRSGSACLCSPTVIRAARVRAELRNVLAVDQRLLAAALGHARQVARQRGSQ